MSTFGMAAYMSTVIPGCIGAGRHDRISHYFLRSLLLITVLMLPLYIVQFFSSDIMQSLGVQKHIADDVGVYTRMMLVTSWLLLLENHLATIFINLNYAHFASINSLVTGLGVDLFCSYYFIYHLELGIRGAAYTQMTVKACRVVIWLALTFATGNVNTVFGAFWRSENAEPLLSSKEFRVFLSQAAPNLLSNFAGWFIFELQIMAVTNIQHIPDSAVTAGAIWIQMESTLAAVQTGWLQTTNMRALVLLAKLDPGAPKSYSVLCFLSFIFVGVSNVALLIWSGKLSNVISNDHEVQHWLHQIMWVLVVHTQTRILSLNAQNMFVPIGKGTEAVALNLIGFYVVATPIVAVLALTNYVTTSVRVKLTLCVAGTSMAQVPIALLGFAYLIRLDWVETGRLIRQRANSDK